MKVRTRSVNRSGQNMTTANVTSVVLAGGLGTRIKHLLPEIPKPMAGVEGRPFLEWVLRYLAAEGIREAILSTGYKASIIEQHFDVQPVAHMSICCRRETEPIGTAGGFLNAIAGYRPEPSAWLVSNGDSLALAPLEPFVSSLDTNRWDACLLGIRMSDASRFGTMKADLDGLLEAFHEKRSGAGLINAGIYVFRPEVLTLFPKKPVLSFETEVFPHLLAHGVRIGVYVSDAPFIDIGTPASLGEAATFIKSHRTRFGVAD